jgi:hypothetical protein
LFLQLTRFLLFSLTLIPTQTRPGLRPSEPRRISFPEAQRLLSGETEGNLSSSKNYSCTRLHDGKVLELFYPLSGQARSGKGARAVAPGFGLIYESEAALQAAAHEAARPHHILEEMIPDSRVFISRVPQLIDQLAKRLHVTTASLDYSPASLRRLDLFIAGHHHSRTTAETDPQLFQEITAYYGESLRRATSGEWVVRPESIDTNRRQSVPNIAVPGGSRDLKPWSAVFTVLYDEEHIGVKLATLYDSDVTSASR